MKVTLKDNYPNSPVTEVAWEIVFEDVDHFDNELLNSFYEKMNENYPLNEVINLVGFGFSFQRSNINQSFSPPNEAGMQFFKDDSRNNMMKIFIDKASNSVHYSILTRVHSNFVEFFNIISSILTIFNDIFQDITNSIYVKRLGLRYINLCDLPDNDYNRYEEYFSIPLNIENHTNSLGMMNNFQIILEELYTNQELIQDNKVIGELKTGFLRSVYASLNHKNVPKIAMDYDSFILEKSKFSLEKVLINTRILHNLIKRRFEDNITLRFEKDVMLKEGK